MDGSSFSFPVSQWRQGLSVFPVPKEDQVEITTLFSQFYFDSDDWPVEHGSF